MLTNILQFFKSPQRFFVNPFFQLVVITVVIVVFLIFSSYIWLFPAIKKVEENATSLQKITAIHAKDLLDIYLSRSVENNLLAGKILLNDSKNREMNSKLIFDSFPNYLSITLLDKTGQIIWGSKKDANSPDQIPKQENPEESYIKDSLQGKKVFSPVYFKSSTPVLKIFAPLFLDAEIVGVTVTEIDLSQLWGVVDSLIVPDGKIYIVDANGTVISSGDSNPRLGENLRFRRIVDQLILSQKMILNSHYNNEKGERVIATGLLIPNSLWGVVVEQSESKVLEQKNETALVAITFASASVILTLLLLISTFRIIALDKLKDEFIALVSHNFRTPLTAVQGYLSFLKADTTVSNKSVQYLQKLEFNVKVIQRLVEEILNISIINSKTNQGNFVAKDLKLVILAATKEVDILSLDKNLHINFNFPDEQIIILGDIDRIQDVIVNLLDNAIKYSDAGEKIDITVKLLGGFVEVSVTDYGAVITQSTVRQLFQKFHRGSDFIKYKHKGIGLGLYFAKIVIQNHGGKIWASPNPEKGATFSFTLPVSRNQTMGKINSYGP